MKKMSFSQYLESKEKLREAVRRTPQNVISYLVQRNSRLMVQNHDGKKYLHVSPNAIINVIWLYEDKRKPIPVRIFFENTNSASEDDRFYTSWSGEKLNNWLKKNTKPKAQN